MEAILETIKNWLPSLQIGDKLVIERDDQGFHARVVFHEVVEQIITTNISQNK